MKVCIKKDWAELRRRAYGPLEEQIDFMTKYGPEALSARNQAIKASIPKTNG